MPLCDIVYEKVSNYIARRISVENSIKSFIFM